LNVEVQKPIPAAAPERTDDYHRVLQRLTHKRPFYKNIHSFLETLKKEILTSLTLIAYWRDARMLHWLTIQLVLFLETLLCLAFIIPNSPIFLKKQIMSWAENVSLHRGVKIYAIIASVLLFGKFQFQFLQALHQL
jgi:hypothetical protein